MSHTPKDAPNPGHSPHAESPIQLAELTLRLRKTGCVFAEEEAQLLLDAAGDAQELEALTAQRVSGIPLERILGWAAFHGQRIRVTEGVFVPRLRTEFLVSQAAEILRSPTALENDVVLDLCCGSGAIAASVVADFPHVEMYAADIDPNAVACAKTNLGALGQAIHSDLFAGLPTRLRGRIRLITANAPYVPSGDIEFMPREARDFEPTAALDGGVDGLDLHRRIAREAKQWLAPGGTLVIECSRRQAPHSLKIFECSGYLAKIRSSDELDATAVIATAL